jgi:RNA polymerase sigma factor (TIGR02999 family)
MPEVAAQLTELLVRWRGGDRRAFDQLMARVYGDLERIARARLGGEALTLTASDLVHEAAIGLASAEGNFRDRAHFFATASLAMRSILVDHARARSASKRGGDWVRVTLTAGPASDDAMAIELLALEQALESLAAVDARSADAMQLSCYGGLDQDEIAAVLGVSVPTVKRDLRFARAWIARAIGDGD